MPGSAGGPAGLARAIPGGRRCAYPRRGECGGDVVPVKVGDFLVGTDLIGDAVQDVGVGAAGVWWPAARAGLV
ncbi:MAG: hypothetical protein L0I76_23550 [Pseudonocardia sp.]|nr:hypothetical protein [Pseudonocardia sp.]